MISGASECSVVSLISHALLMFLNLRKCVSKAKGVMKLKASFTLPFRFFLYSNSFSVFSHVTNQAMLIEPGSIVEYELDLWGPSNVFPRIRPFIMMPITLHI